MKKLLNLSGVFVILVIMVSVSCQQQSSQTKSHENLGQIKIEMQDVIEKIDEVLNEEDVSVFINNTDIILNKIDNHIDEYLNMMDEADQRIDKESRNIIIRIKQKEAGIDFRLALIDDSTPAKRPRPFVYPYYDYYHILFKEITPEQDDTVRKGKVQYGKEVQKEIIKDLKDIKSEIELFIKTGL